MNKILTPAIIYPEYQEGTDYVLGSETVAAPYTVLNPSMDWRKAVSPPEVQRSPYGDTNGCTVFGSLNMVEILMNFLGYTVDTNYAERFNAVLSGQTMNGNDPHKVLESMRNDGVIEESLLPYTQNMNINQYLSPKPMSSIFIEKGKEWLQQYVLKHEYVYPPTGNTSVADKKRLLKEALKRSPVGVSVFAWTTDDNGVYIKPRGQKYDTHWCVLVYIDENDTPWVYDSYAPHFKKLSWDHFDIAKGIYVEKVDRVSLLEDIAYLLNEIILKLVTMFGKKNILDVALSKLGTDASPSDLAPDELGCAESVSTILHEVDKTFPIVTGTYTLMDVLERHPNFVRVTIPMPGDIILAATHTGNGKIRGHVGIMGRNMSVMSNQSYGVDKGKFMANYTYDTFLARYKDEGGFPIRMYHCLYK